MPSSVKPLNTRALYQPESVAYSFPFELPSRPSYSTPPTLLPYQADTLERIIEFGLSLHTRRQKQLAAAPDSVVIDRDPEPPMVIKPGRIPANQLELMNNNTQSEDHKNGIRPLHRAAEAPDELGAVKMLIGANAEIDPMDCHGDTPLLKAARSGNTAAVEVLIAFRADTSCANFKGETALGVAEAEGHADIARMISASQTRV